VTKHTTQLSLFTTAPNDPTLEIPYGYCHCGCGQTTNISKENRPRDSVVKGEPYRFVKGHQGRRPQLERFWEKVDKRGPDECWLWTGSLVDGYGTFKVGTETIKTHRFSYEIHIGAIPVGLYVLHRCDVRNCVNPNHFFLGTHADNMKDMVAKGRQSAPRGEQHHNARLTDAKVVAIRQLRKQGRGPKYIAETLNVTRSQVGSALRKDGWVHVK
jgi:hypothetical protein